MLRLFVLFSVLLSLILFIGSLSLFCFGFFFVCVCVCVCVYVTDSFSVDRLINLFIILF